MKFNFFFKHTFLGHAIELFCLMGFAPVDINLQLMSKLAALDLPRANVPILLRCEDEAPEELATEELAENWLRRVREVNKPAAKFRWRRSKWGRYCPVALAQGEIATGAPELSLAFLGKMYFFSSVERMDYFKINPRKYLLPSEPRNAIRVAVTGHAGAGKSTLVARLAEHYNCDVINIVDVCSNVQIEANQKSFQTRLDEAREAAMTQVNNENSVDGVVLNPVDANDNRVVALVEQKLNGATLADERAQLSPAVIVEGLKKHIDELETGRAERGEEGPHAGRWIIDGFPATKDDWTAMAEAELVPNDLLVVRDQTDKFEHLIEKHYQDNKSEIDQAFAQRLNDENKQKSEADEEGEGSNRPLHSAPEFDKFRSKVGQNDVQLANMISQASQSTQMTLSNINYVFDKQDQIAEDAVIAIDSRFKIQGKIKINHF